MQHADRKLLLASDSPRRREMLAQLDVAYHAQGVDVDETTLPGESAAEYLQRVVGAKGSAATELAHELGIFAWLVADTIVVSGGKILGKPADDAEHLTMLQSLSASAHQVMTRFSLGQGRRVVESRTVVTTLRFRTITPAEMQRYIAHGEGRDKAGGYGVQGLAAMFVESIDGSYSSVVGLPLCEVVVALSKVGLGPHFDGDLARRLETHVPPF